MKIVFVVHANANNETLCTSSHSLRIMLLSLP
jgi:hypothetical protein